MFKIENDSDGHDAILRLSGRIDSEQVPELNAQIENGSHCSVLDLEEVKLVDRDVVQFLEACESEGIELRIVHPTFESGSAGRRCGMENHDRS